MAGQVSRGRAAALAGRPSVEQRLVAAGLAGQAAAALASARLARHR